MERVRMISESELELRPEEEADRMAIHALNVAAFGGSAEARLVDALREAGALRVSLVARIDSQLAGHIAFSPIKIVSATRTTSALALAPMVVRPDQQRRGIGSMLLRAGLAACKPLADLVVVLGHPGYYPRFGFIPAHPLGIECPYPAPFEAFLIKELVPGSGGRHRGMVSYHPAFGGL